MGTENEPRVPAGSPEGGEWTTDAGPYLIAEKGTNGRNAYAKVKSAAEVNQWLDQNAQWKKTSFDTEHRTHGNVGAKLEVLRQVERTIGSEGQTAKVWQPEQKALPLLVRDVKWMSQYRD